jgi:diguanylate cyclase (GGDEF)-like protein
MHTLSQRATSAFTVVCVLFTLTVAAVGVVAIIGVRSNTAATNRIATDELATTVGTARVGRLLDTAYSTGSALVRTADPAVRATFAAALYERTIPSLETRIADLVAMHADDAPAELATIRNFQADWRVLRAVLVRIQLGATGPGTSATGAELSTAYAPMSTMIDEFIDHETVDATRGRDQANANGDRATQAIIWAVIAVLLGMGGLLWFGRRAVRRAVEPTQDQVEFADTLQLAQDEDETHQLLQRYLERSIPDSTAVVLNRNNSADRLEAMTTLPLDSPLASALHNATPQSCLAVRSAQPHTENGESGALMVCAVCSDCPGESICNPLTVGGEVIGAVLMNRPTPYGLTDLQRIRDSVTQAAPVLANLRNLALAEFRAATDSLTGLPNKRAVADTIKRMFAQAWRTQSPISLVMLDLDHFKNINDRFGHAVGDQALANVGAALRAALRDSDFAGRNGGEEFCVVLPDTEPDGARDVAEKIRTLVADITLPGIELTVTASVGIATFPDHASSVERLERLADGALYLAKRSGRDRIEVARPPDEGAGVPVNGAKAEQGHFVTTEPLIRG